MDDSSGVTSTAAARTAEFYGESRDRFTHFRRDDKFHDRLVGDTREVRKFPKPIAVKHPSSTFSFSRKYLRCVPHSTLHSFFYARIHRSRVKIWNTPDLCKHKNLSPRNSHSYLTVSCASLRYVLGLVFSRRGGRVRFASREQRRPCIIIWYVCARAVNTCCASSMKYVLTSESDALEAFPARPCNIYVLLVTSCIAKSYFSGRNACLYSDSFSRVQRKHKRAARVHRDDIVRRCMISSLIVSNELSVIYNDERSNL